ncbi:hypothetical protein PT015_05085 [Candidatus Mycobacterium wuenschmannii]|uniref:Secreted protein n=1 Tax=Candidatus Mycobacterium wuenschmannii TaxID=3027808 RepID=A0ABY8W0V8_9MYCO|nr:hypothetical protein [Candidatus Mycobacterium wuenschmannii]WIM88855.1 hypothetical protein PT015_05085 [Candidatus Mycobacterium wuenschmannii]
MKLTRLAALAAVLTGAAVGLAAPAFADLADGAYQATPDQPDMKVLNVVVSSCGVGCKNIAGIVKDDLPFHLDGASWTSTDRFGDVRTIDNNSLTGTWTSQFLEAPVNYHYVKAG